MNFKSLINDALAEDPAGARHFQTMRSKPMTCSARSKNETRQPANDADKSKTPAAHSGTPALGSSLRFAIRSIKKTGL